jgi:hypothetical protein
MAKIGIEDVILAFGCLIRSSEMNGLETMASNKARGKGCVYNQSNSNIRRRGISKKFRSTIKVVERKIISTNWAFPLFQLGIFIETIYLIIFCCLQLLSCRCCVDVKLLIAV